MQRWSIGTSAKEGYTLGIEDVKVWALALEHGFEKLCHVTGGRAGGHGLGEWAWKVPLGRSKWDLSVPGDPWLTNSLAGGLMDLENWTFNVGHRHGTDTKFPRIPLTHDQAVAIDPDFVADFDSLGDDD